MFFIIIHFLLFGALKIEAKSRSPDVIRIVLPYVLPQLKPLFSFLEGFEGSGAPPGSLRVAALRAAC